MPNTESTTRQRPHRRPPEPDAVHHRASATIVTVNVAARPTRRRVGGAGRRSRRRTARAGVSAARRGITAVPAPATTRRAEQRHEPTASVDMSRLYGAAAGTREVSDRRVFGSWATDGIAISGVEIVTGAEIQKQRARSGRPWRTNGTR